MTAYNVVRFRVKPGRDQEFIDLHRKSKADFKGWRNGALVKTGDRAYCLVGEWDSFDNIVDARPGMIGMLDSFRELLEDLGNGLGVTDPISGETVLQLKTRAAARSAKPKTKRKAKRAAAKTARKPANKKKAAKKKSARRRRR